MKTFDKQVLVDKIFDEGKERCLLNSLIICLFARKVYDRETILSALNVIGYDQTQIKIPKRYFQTPRMNG